ncbi:Bidirectional sugar transporter SWEET1 [Linum perenne]
MTDIPHFIFGILGNAFAAFLFLAPTISFFCGCFHLCINGVRRNSSLTNFRSVSLSVFSSQICVSVHRITFRRIIKNKSTEEFSGVPYPMTLLNCLLSAWYGLPFVSKDNLLVTTINGTGAAIEIIYVIIFLVFAPKKQKAKIGGIFAAVLSVFAAVSLISYFALHGNTRKLFCGTAATVFSIIMYASPLSIMRLVIKTKSVEFMPFFLSLFVFLCGTSWFIYGLLGRDPFIAVPNGFGCALGLMQLILYFIYRNHDKKKAEQTSSMEMGAQKPHRDAGVNGNSNGTTA